MNAQLLDQFAAARPDLPHPLEAPAVVDKPINRVPDYVDALVTCGHCGEHPLTAREYQPDFDHDGERYVWCGNDTCRPCEDDIEACVDEDAPAETDAWDYAR